MNRPVLASLLAVGLLVVASSAFGPSFASEPSFAFGQQNTVDTLPARTFPEFTGTWVRDDSTDGPRQASATPDCGTTPARAPACTPVGGFESSPVSPPEPKLVITTTPTRITLARTPLTPYGPEVYRFDGVTTTVGNGQGTLTLAAGSLILTKRSARMAGNYESITMTSDMLSVSGDVLTIERQYSRIVRPLDGDKVGHFAATNGDDARVKMVYRRETPAQ